MSVIANSQTKDSGTQFVHGRETLFEAIYHITWEVFLVMKNVMRWVKTDCHDCHKVFTEEKDHSCVVLLNNERVLAIRRLVVLRD